MLVLCAADEHRITSLPGLSRMPPWAMYAGTVQVAGNASLFYWFVESQAAPSRDPLLLWLNGGPGCSSLLGFLTENGPYRVGNNGSLTPNPWSWNLQCHLPRVAGSE